MSHWLGEYIGAPQLTWSPTYSTSGGTLGSVTTNRAVAYRIGHLILCTVDFTITNNGTGFTNFLIALPSNCINGPFCGWGINLSTGNTFVGSQTSGTNIASLRRWDADYGLVTGSRVLYHHTYEVSL